MVFKTDIVFHVINVYSCCLILLFVLTRFLIIGISYKAYASFFFTPLSYFICFAGYLFVHTPFFFWNYLNFWVFLYVPQLVDNYDKIVDERGRNLICGCTLPSLLVYYKIKLNSCYTIHRTWIFCTFYALLYNLYCLSLTIDLLFI